jgi:pilus assembly protein CpaC
MHRTICSRSPSWGVLVALLLAALPSAVRGQASPGGAVIVPINGTVRLQMSTKKEIKTINNPKDTAISIRPVAGDPTTVLITGVAPDFARVEMIDVDGKKETFDVIVQLDVEYLKTQLKRAVPTAHITPIPTSNTTVILAGTVTKAEDVDIIMRVAQSIPGVVAVNAIRVGGVQQVQLDVTVALVSRSEFRRMAFNFLYNSQNTYLASTVGQAAVNPVVAGATSSTLNAALFGQVLSATPGAPGGAPTNFLGGILKNNWGLLSFLQALRDENVLKLVSEPKLVTLSGRPASFLAGGEQAIPVPAGLGQVGVQFEEFGTRLNFLPIVMGNGKIHLEVEPEVSDLNPANGTSIGGTVVPGRNTNRVNTTVQLEAGQTFVIGGLLQHRVRANMAKVPVLGDIPFLNVLFSSKSYEEIEDEVIIMVTPYLVDAQSCDQVVKCLPGQETRSPDDFELFLEGILEAPRGPRQVFRGNNYVPAYKNDPSYGQYPCGKPDCCVYGSCFPGCCGKGGCGAGCGNGCGNGCGDGSGCYGGPAGYGLPYGAAGTKPIGMPYAGPSEMLEGGVAPATPVRSMPPVGPAVEGAGKAPDLPRNALTPG